MLTSAERIGKASDSIERAECARDASERGEWLAHAERDLRLATQALASAELDAMGAESTGELRKAHAAMNAARARIAEARARIKRG
jgi:hypothetical protein